MKTFAKVTAVLGLLGIFAGSAFAQMAATPPPAPMASKMAPAAGKSVKGYMRKTKSGKMVAVKSYVRGAAKPKMVAVKGYTRTTKTGKMVTVKGYTRKK